MVTLYRCRRASGISPRERADADQELLNSVTFIYSPENREDAAERDLPWRVGHEKHQQPRQQQTPDALESLHTHVGPWRHERQRQSTRREKITWCGGRMVPQYGLIESSLTAFDASKAQTGRIEGTPG